MYRVLSEKERMARRWFFNPYFLLIFFAGLFSFKFTYSLPSIFDLIISDEAGYIEHAVRFSWGDYLLVTFGPLYIRWLHVLYEITSDPIAVYFLNYQLLSAFTGTAFALALHRFFRVSVSTALLFSFLAVISYGGLIPFPKHGNFAAALIMTGLAVGSMFQTQGMRLFFTSLSLLCASYVRPEYYLGFLFSFGFYALLLFRERTHSKNLKTLSLQILALLGIGLVFAQIFHGLPIVGDNGDTRRWLSFLSRFKAMWAEWNHIPVYEMPSDDYFSNTLFGGAHSTLAAAKANPLLYGKYLFTCISRTITRPLFMVFGHFNLVFPYTSRIGTYVEAGLFFIAVLSVAFFRRKWVYSSLRTLLSWRSPYLEHCFALACILFTNLIAGIFFYAAESYLVPTSLLVFGALACLCNFSISKKLRSPLLLACILLLLVPAPRAWWLVEAEKQPVLTKIRTIQNLKLKPRPARVFDEFLNYDVFLGDRFTKEFRYDPTHSFSHFIEKKQFDVISLENILLNFPQLAKDQGYNDFLNQPEQFGYVARDRIFVRKEALSE